MKIRIYFPKLPFPITEGSFQIVVDHGCSLIDAGHEVEWVFWQPQRKEIAIWDYGKTIYQPHVTRLHAEPPPLQIARFLRGLGGSHTAPELSFYGDVQGLENLGSVDVAFYHYSFAYRWFDLERKGLLHLPDEKKTVVVFHGLESNLYDAKFRADPAWKSWSSAITSQKLRLHELELSYLVDELWFVSQTDLDEYRNRLQTETESRDIDSELPAAKLLYVPPGIRTASFESRIISRLKKNSRPATPDAATVGFVGSLDFLPSLSSAQWIVRDLGPELEKCGFTGRVQIVGRNPPKELVREANIFQFIDFQGFVPDLNPFWQRIDWFLCPQIYGTGVQIKALEALSSGVRVLTNTSAADALEPRWHKNHLLKVSDSPVEWAQIICARTST